MFGSFEQRECDGETRRERRRWGKVFFLSLPTDAASGCTWAVYFTAAAVAELEGGRVRRALHRSSTASADVFHRQFTSFNWLSLAFTAFFDRPIAWVVGTILRCGVARTTSLCNPRVLKLLAGAAFRFSQMAI